jgi:hypothetical protein
MNPDGCSASSACCATFSARGVAGTTFWVTGMAHSIAAWEPRRLAPDGLAAWKQVFERDS